MIVPLRKLNGLRKRLRKHENCRKAFIGLCLDGENRQRERCKVIGSQFSFTHGH